jgi:CRISPR/Cas system CMR-associated protein Cmr5 small subunit
VRSSKHVGGLVVTYQQLSNLVFNLVFEINESNQKIIQRFISYCVFE